MKDHDVTKTATYREEEEADSASNVLGPELFIYSSHLAIDIVSVPNDGGGGGGVYKTPGKGGWGETRRVVKSVPKRLLLCSFCLKEMSFRIVETLMTSCQKPRIF